METGLKHSANTSVKGKLVLLLASLCLVLTASAKQLYKWQDDEGIWHFSDEPPKNGQKVESRQIKVEPKPRLEMQDVGAKNRPTYQFTNNFFGPMEITVALQNADNIVSEPLLPAKFVLHGREQQTLVNLRPQDRGKRWGFRIETHYIPGDPAARHDDTILYLTPFPDGMRFPVSQGFNGASTHQEDDARYAVDIVMPIGTPVVAAREGVVMDVEDDFFGSGQDRKKFGNRANVVRILHEDGTMAVYAHLKPDSIRVHPGYAVLAGEQIAESGNTGFSSGPHLHFVIQRNAGMALQSVPFKFRTRNGKAIVPDRPMMLGEISLPQKQLKRTNSR